MLELAIFNTPLTNTQMTQILAQMQDANGIRADGDSTLVVFVGDSQTAGQSIEPFYNSYEYQLCRLYGNSFKPLSIAYPGATCETQLTYVNNQLVPMDLTPFSKAVVICCCGINDVVHGALTDVQTEALLTSLTSAITGISGVKLILAVPPHLDSGTTMTSGQLVYFHAYQAWIRSNWKSLGAAALLDWTTDSRLADAASTDIYWQDEFHTTETGDRVKAQLAKTVLDSVLSASSSSSSQAQLAFGSFYLPGNSYSGTFGQFVRS